MSQSIVIDTDPGVDDAMAIFMALASPELKVEALVSVAGNVEEAKTTKNALTLLELVGRQDVPVIAGANQPLVKPQHIAKAHGTDGLGESNYPPPAGKPISRDAVSWYREFFHSRPDKSVTLVVLGPMTNIALLAEADEAALRRAKQIVVMGGATEIAGGNSTLYAEFNFYVDPDAADRVFALNLPLVLAPLDVAYRMVVKAERLAAMTKGSGQVAKALARMVRFYGDVDGHIYDPLTIAWVLWPELFKGQRAFGRVTTSGVKIGQSRFTWDPKGPIEVLLDGDAPALFTRLEDLLAKL